LSESAVIFEYKKNSQGHITAYATLNAEKSLNSLSKDMIRLLSPKLDEWAKDSNIACVVLQGAGEKAFCAGGDIVDLYKAMTSQEIGNPVPEAFEFFRMEYDLDYKIHTYPKPIINMGHGIVMGGGLGLHAGASHRILSERSMIAMPEITIGLYPDVGASWFLNRMPGRCGLFLGLTGSRMKTADALFVGLGDFYIRRDLHSEFLQKVSELSWSDDRKLNKALINKVARSYQGKSLKLDGVSYYEMLNTSEVRKHFDFIQDVTSVDNISEFHDRLNNLQIDEKWIQFAKKTFLAGSPTSAGVIFEQLIHTKHFSLKECFDFEYKLSCKFAAHPDFREGIRALLIDKDMAPKWTPKNVQDLQKKDIQKILQGPLSNGHTHSVDH